VQLRRWACGRCWEGAEAEDPARAIGDIDCWAIEGEAEIGIYQAGGVEACEERVVYDAVFEGERGVRVFRAWVGGGEGWVASPRIPLPLPSRGSVILPATPIFWLSSVRPPNVTFS
jgi:hypothetical protein